MADENKVAEATTGVEPGQEGATEQPKTFDDLLKDNKGYQSEFDKRVAKALETSKAKWEKDYEAKKEAEKNEAERLAKMTEAEKYQEALKKIEAEKREAEAKLNAYELKNEAQKIASEKGIDISLLDLIDYTTATAETLKEKLDLIEKAYKKAVESGVNEKLKQPSPKQVANGNTATSDKAYMDKKYANNPYYKKK